MIDIIRKGCMNPRPAARAVDATFANDIRAIFRAKGLVQKTLFAKEQPRMARQNFLN